jgi:5'-nucleotidase
MKKIIISNPEKLEETKRKIKQGGKEKLHVIADFDQTLTKAYVDGEKAPSSVAQIRRGGYLTKDYAPRSYALYDKYHPIEISLKIDKKEKRKKMQEWWKKHFDLLIECGMNKEVIDDIVKKKKLGLRKGVPDFLKTLDKNDIPLVIMSAGPGDLIKEFLKSQKILLSNTHIIADFFIFNENGRAIRVKEPLIHSLNKNEISIKNLKIYKELLKRKNVLLFGDILEDIDMIEGFEYDNLIKVGFLNEINPFKKGLTQNQDFKKDFEENLEKFKENYDVVILNDGSFEFVNELVGELIE